MGSDGKVNSKAPLSYKQVRFIEEYLIDLNATQAAIRAGYSEASAQQIGCKLLRNERIASAIGMSEEKRSERTQISQDRVLKELARVAFFDPRLLFDAKGHPKALHELDDDTAAAVAGVVVHEEFSGKGKSRVKVGDVRKWKLANKIAALGMVARHLGMLAERAESPESHGEQVILFLPDNQRGLEFTEQKVLPDRCE